MKDKVKRELEMINTFLNGNAWYDFMVHKVDTNNNLHIIGSTDLCYYYGIKIIFYFDMENASRNINHIRRITCKNYFM
jgi:hypothetical protein